MAFPLALSAQSKRGDVNGDGKVDISDIVAVINIIATGGDDRTVTYEVKGVKFKMVEVDGGVFKMGSESGDDDETPVHEVKLKSFSIGQTEVTQELWETVMGTNSSNWKGLKLPVENVSWNDCQTFITKLNAVSPAYRGGVGVCRPWREPEQGLYLQRQ